MTCIERRPDCGDRDSATRAPEPLGGIGSVFAVIGTVFSALAAVGSVAGALEVAGGIVSVVVGGQVILVVGSAGLGAMGGSAGAIAMLVLIGTFAIDRCTQGEGEPECIAGVIHEIFPSFRDAWEEVFPFTGMHDRVDVIVKARFWDTVESHNAYVHCTEEPYPRRSEILRCYFYDKRVCVAAKGALIGGTVGAVAGVVAAAAVIAAIGCATIILCLFALILAALIAAVAVLVGAFIGGQVGKAVSTDTSPTAGPDGPALAVADYVTVRGNLQRRDNDQGANTFWWSSSASLHGRASDATPRPFSYCELDEAFPVDGCPVVRDPVR